MKGQQALRIESNDTSSPNLVGGYNSNGTSNNAVGAVISGGGASGELNQVSDDYGVVAGGTDNTAGDGSDSNNGQYATVSGGSGNTASGQFSSVPGGSMAKATLYGQQAYASGSFSTAGDAQGSTYVLRGVSGDTLPSTVSLSLDGGTQRLTIPNNRTVMFEILVVGRAMTGTNSAGYRIYGAIKNTGGTLSLIGSPTVNAFENSGTWNATVLASGTYLDIRVTGSSSTSVLWVATVHTAEVSN